MNTIEFSGDRSSLYKEALHEFPNARQQDLVVMKEYLNPQPGNQILEVGAGSGFFSGMIADAVLPGGGVTVSDPSDEQLDAVNVLQRDNIAVVQNSAAQLDSIPDASFDKIWSFGAIHHEFYKTSAWQHFFRVLKPGGEVIIVDVLSGSALAKHFDEQVAKYSVSGHEVSFLSKEYAKSLFEISGLSNISMVDLDIQWEFKEEANIGVFLYKLHAMTKVNPEECLRGAKEMLGVSYEKDMWYLNWPLTVFRAKKA